MAAAFGPPRFGRSAGHHSVRARMASWCHGERSIGTAPARTAAVSTAAVKTAAVRTAALRTAAGRDHRWPDGRHRLRRPSADDRPYVRRARRVPGAFWRVLSTAAAAERLGNFVTVMPAWQNLDIETPDRRVVSVTAVSAQHGPDGSLPLVGEVIGFVLRCDELPSVYVSGDNASLRVVQEIADRVGQLDVDCSRRRRVDSAHPRRVPHLDELRGGTSHRNTRRGKGSRGAHRQLAAFHRRRRRRAKGVRAGRALRPIDRL